MKKVIVLHILILAFISCSDSEIIDGDWDDVIKLSQKEIKFSSEQHVANITTEGKGWWISEISLNGKAYDIHGIDTTKENFTINEAEFTLERINATNIHITVGKNQTGKERILIVGLQTGDYFDSIKITQSTN